MTKINPIQYNPFVAAMYSQNAIQNSQPLSKPATNNEEYKVHRIAFGAGEPTNKNSQITPAAQPLFNNLNISSNHLDGRAPTAVSGINCGQINGKENICAQKLPNLYA